MINPYIEYFEALCGKEEAPATLAELIDCTKLSEILAHIPEFPSLSLEHHPQTFSEVFANLKDLYKKVEEFWNVTLDRELDTEEIDLVDIAHNKNQRQITKILDLVIQSMVMSSQRDFFVQKILETSASTQQFFMKIVERTLEQRKTFSPRKQREQRLYDKMIQLDHENEHLQSVISVLCQQKHELQTKYKIVLEKVQEKDQQIGKLNDTVSDFLQTPQKKKNNSYYDTQQKNNEFIDKLKDKILEMTKEHEKEILQMKQQIQFYVGKMERLDFLENQIDGYNVRFEASRDALEQYEEMSKKYAEIKLSLMQKNETISEYTDKLTAKNQKIQELEEKIIERDLEIERKSIQLQEQSQYSVSKYSADDQVTSSFAAISLQKTLSEHCPQIANNQAQFLYENNKKLRQELQRASTSVKEREIELERLKKNYERRENLETQNKKLSGVIEQISEQHEEEKYVLLSCMHDIRLKFLNQFIPKSKRQQIKKLSTQAPKKGFTPIQRKRVQA